jgi:hypothetical protein
VDVKHVRDDVVGEFGGDAVELGRGGALVECVYTGVAVWPDRVQRESAADGSQLGGLTSSTLEISAVISSQQLQFIGMMRTLRTR